MKEPGQTAYEVLCSRAELGANIAAALRALGEKAANPSRPE